MDKQTSLMGNALLSFFKTFLSVMFPIVTFAYASRILGVDGIGKVTFSRNTMTYFTMFAMLGVNYYGTREVAKLRGDRTKLSLFSQEMLIINGAMTIISYCLFIISLFVIDKLQDYKILLIVNSVAIAFSSLGMDWLYQGLEEFKYIAKRTVLFQFIALVFMLCMVKSPDDLVYYSIVLIISSSGANILNLLSSRRFIDYEFNRKYELRRHAKSLLWLFAFSFSIELYTVLDSTMLGFMKDDYAVGIYTVAIKANKMTDILITSLGVALIPRLSYYIGVNDTKRTQDLICKAYNYIFMLSIPCCLGMFILSPAIVLLFSGENFMPANLTIKMLTPIILIIPFNVLTNIQIFIPLKMEKLVLISSVVAVVTNFFSNLFFIPLYSHNGAAIATVLAEAASAIVCFYNLRKIVKLNCIFSSYAHYWIASIPILFIGYIFNMIINDCLLNIIAVVSVSMLSYSFILWHLKNNYFMDAFIIIAEKIKCKQR